MPDHIVRRARHIYAADATFSGTPFTLASPAKFSPWFEFHSPTLGVAHQPLTRVDLELHPYPEPILNGHYPHQRFRTKEHHPRLR